MPPLRVETSLLVSAARSTSSNKALPSYKAVRRARLFLDVTAVAGVGPTLDIDVEAQDPASGKWFVVASFTQATGVTQERVDVAAPIGTLRVAWTIGGSGGPSATFSLGLVLED